MISMQEFKFQCPHCKYIDSLLISLQLGDHYIGTNCSRCDRPCTILTSKGGVQEVITKNPMGMNLFDLWVDRQPLNTPESVTCTASGSTGLFPPYGGIEIIKDLWADHQPPGSAFASYSTSSSLVNSPFISIDSPAEESEPVVIDQPKVDWDSLPSRRFKDMD
jgi:hypothetical protein